MIISDLLAGIKAKLGNRTDTLLTTRYPYWVAESCLELSQWFELEQLKEEGPLTALTPQVAKYQQNTFTNNNEAWTFCISFFFQLQGTNGIGWNMKYRAFSFVKPLTVINSVCNYWCTQGDYIYFGFAPNLAYNVQFAYQKVHPFTMGASDQIAPVAGDTVYFPNDWQDILEYSAALRGASEYRAWDYVDKYTTMLQGDEEWRASGGTMIQSGKKGKPGIIFGRISKQQRNGVRNERQLNLVVPRY